MFSFNSLVYEAVDILDKEGYGFTTIVCVGGDPILGTAMKEVIESFAQDEDTKAIVMLGEIGGTAELECIDSIKKTDKPVIAYISGHCAPPEKKMGHAGAIITGDLDTASVKTEILLKAGVRVVYSLEDILFEINLLNILKP